MSHPSLVRHSFLAAVLRILSAVWVQTSVLLRCTTHPHQRPPHVLVQLETKTHIHSQHFITGSIIKCSPLPNMPTTPAYVATSPPYCDNMTEMSTFRRVEYFTLIKTYGYEPFYKVGEDMQTLWVREGRPARDKERLRSALNYELYQGYLDSNDTITVTDDALTRLDNLPCSHDVVMLAVRVVYATNNNSLGKCEQFCKICIDRAKRQELWCKPKSVWGQECVICYHDMIFTFTAEQCPTCRKMFHTRCIERWLSSTPTCPCCRSVHTYNPRPPDVHMLCATMYLITVVTICAMFLGAFYAVKLVVQVVTIVSRHSTTRSQKS